MKFITIVETINIKMLIVDWFMFLLIQIIFLTVAEAQRDVLEATLQAGDNEIISLKWMKAESYLANENLPVWTTMFDNTLQLNLDVMKRIGKFTPYYDFDKNSAILFMEKWNCIYGVIDIRYFIRCLSFDDLFRNEPLKSVPGQRFLLKSIENTSSTHVIEAAYDNISDTMLNEFQMLIETIVLPHLDSVSQPMDLSKTRGPIVYEYEKKIIEVYPEVLIIIPHVESLISRNDVEVTVIENLVQFNAVAMLFAKLAQYDIKIHINIAAILIEMDGVGFSRNFTNDSPVSGPSILESLIKTINSLQPYSNNGRTQKRVFIDDSFDFFIYITSNRWLERELYPGGYSTPVHDVLKVKSTSRIRYPTARLGSIVDSSKILNLYSYVAREIAHLMMVSDDPPDCSSISNEQCHRIMAPLRSCPKCLTWSSASILSFRKYLSTNRNRCFLRNFPRSLRPFDTPAKTLFPVDQCLCYEYRGGRDWSYIDSRKGDDKVCNGKIHCKDFNKFGDKWKPSIIDGTPCDANNRNKVCWRNECVPIPQPAQK